MEKYFRRTWVEVNLDALKHNYETIESTLSAGSRIMAVVKADAYGHGAVFAAQMIDAFSDSNSSTLCLKRTCFKFSMMLVTSSRTPGTVANSCSTPAILIVLIAKPSSEESRMRRNALPTVVPKPGSKGRNSNLPYLGVLSNITTLSGF